MRLKQFLRLLQKSEVILLSELELSPEDLLVLRSLAGEDGVFRRSKIAINRKTGLPFRRNATPGKQRRQRKLAGSPPSIHFPEGGLWRRFPKSKTFPESRHRFFALASIKSRSRSGTLKSRMVDREPLISIQSTGTIGNLEQAQLNTWGMGMKLERWVAIPLDKAKLHETVFQNAYLGDLLDIQFVDPQLVTATGPCTYPTSAGDVSLEAGSNFVSLIQMPARLKSLTPSRLTLFGPFRPRQESKNVQLCSFPRFDIQVGPLRIESAFLAIETLFSDEAGWDTLASVNGILKVMGASLPISTDLPTVGGFASFNLETAKCPLGKDLADLVPLANGADLFARLGVLPKQITQWQLKRLNLLFDSEGGTLIVISMRIRSGVPLYLLKDHILAASVVSFTLDWQIGMPMAEKIVTSNGKGKGVIPSAGDVPWQVSILTEPELCFQFWAGSESFSSHQLKQWLSKIEGTTQSTVSDYCGCMVSFFGSRVEIHIGDTGQDFPRVYVKEI